MTTEESGMTDYTSLSPADLTEEQARRITEQIKVNAEVTWNLVVEAYQRRAWAALGYRSWDLYCRAEFEGTRLRLPYEKRREVVASLRDAGLSTRAIAAATGGSETNVRRDLDEIHRETSDALNGAPDVGADVEEVEVIDDQPITALDGAQYERTRKTPKAHANYQRAAERRKKVLALLEAEPDIRAKDIAERLNTPQSTISEDLRILGVARSKTRAAVAGRVEAITRMAGTGATRHQIAKKLGIEPKTVADVARHHGIKIHGDVATRGQHRLVPDEVLSNFAGGLLTRISNFDNLMEGRWDEVTEEAGVAADVDLEQVVTDLRRVRRDLIAHKAVPDRWRRSRDEGEEQRQASINITPDSWREFKIKAQSTGDSAAAVLGRLVEAYIKEQQVQ